MGVISSLAIQIAVVCFIFLIQNTESAIIGKPTFHEENYGKINSDIQCPYKNGIFHHPKDCHKFVLCKENVPYEVDCPNSGSNQILLCVPYDESCPEEDLPGRVKRHSKQSWECPYEHRMFAIADDCKRYLHCINKRMLIETCPDGQTFNELESRCIVGYNPDCD